MLGSLVSKTRDDALSKQRNLSCETKTVNTSWSQGYSQPRCRSQQSTQR